MLRDNPLLTMLGRRGRGAIIDVMRNAPEPEWTVRSLARQADVPVAAAARAVHELSALGVVDAIRPGRAMVVRWEPDSAVARSLLPFVVPDLRNASASAFASAYEGPIGSLSVWTMRGDDAADPMQATRIAVVVAEVDQEDAWEAVGPALDAVEAAGWPKPDVGVFTPPLEGEVGRAIRAGRSLLPTSLREQVAGDRLDA